MKTLRYGSSGADVLQLQGGLAMLRYKPFTDNPKEIDGKFGTKTLNAVKQFQIDSGLKSDGIVGADTWSKLSDAVSGKISVKAYSVKIPTTTSLTIPSGIPGVEPTSFGQSVIQLLNTPLYSGFRVGHAMMVSALALILLGARK